MNAVQIRWGSNPADNIEPVSYTFDTRAARDAFLEGVEAAAGWLDYTVLTSEPDDQASNSEYHCDACGSSSMQACLPAYFDANDNFEYCDADYEAMVLTWFCNACGESVAVVKPTGEIERGRWG